MSGTERTAERIIIEYEPAPTKGKEKNRWLGQVILRAYFKLFDEVLPSIRKHGVYVCPFAGAQAGGHLLFTSP